MDTHPSLDFIDAEQLERVLEVLKSKDVQRFKAGSIEIEFAAPVVAVPVPGVFRGDQKTEPTDGTPSGYAAVFGGQPPKFRPNGA